MLYVTPLGFEARAAKAFQEIRRGDQSLTDFLPDFIRYAHLAGRDLDHAETFSQLLESIGSPFSSQLLQAYERESVHVLSSGRRFSYTWTWARRCLESLQAVADTQALLPSYSTSKGRSPKDVKRSGAGLRSEGQTCEWCLKPNHTYAQCLARTERKRAPHPNSRYFAQYQARSHDTVTGSPNSLASPGRASHQPQRACHRCGDPGHLIRNCPVPASVSRDTDRAQASRQAVSSGGSTSTSTPTRHQRVDQKASPPTRHQRAVRIDPIPQSVPLHSDDDDEPIEVDTESASFDILAGDLSLCMLQMSSVLPGVSTLTSLGTQDGSRFGLRLLADCMPFKPELRPVPSASVQSSQTLSNPANAATTSALPVPSPSEVSSVCDIHTCAPTEDCLAVSATASDGADYTRTSPFLSAFEVNGHDVVALIDSGADTNGIHRRLVREWCLTVHPVQGRLLSL